jgi:hypothetical protein
MIPPISREGLFFFIGHNMQTIIALISFTKEVKPMTRVNVRVKSVHFNVTKENDAAMLKHIGRKNFSRYIKKLILEDLSRKKEQQNQPAIKQNGGINFKLD